MNWQDLKASLLAFFQSLSLPNQQYQELELKPIPIQRDPARTRPEHQRPFDRR
ncbi:MAG TPA: hypothetical protein VM553_11385 [Dongiaceae bacterium]|nr:hypothetical protein [Dongiaceae bacterium]